MAKEKVEKAAKAQPKTRKKTTDKWKKKAWYSVLAPAEFENRVIGETISEKPETLMGRTVLISGRDLANQPKKQHVQLKFRVIGTSGTSANTEAVGHEIKDSYLRRVVRRRASKIMSVKNYTSKDGRTFKVKIVIATERKASQKQKASIRRKTEELAALIIADFDSKKVIDELVFGTVPNKIYPELKKIVPIKRIEITKSSLFLIKG
ncbi:MAG: hypothetical protein NUV67_02565 [archaeon]|nr:hypothetical protein [archaeon]